MNQFTGAFWTDRGIDPKMAAARKIDPGEIVVEEDDEA
jgi:hypothetical protein